MVQITDMALEDIAESLHAGFRCFFNKQTGDYKCIPAFDSYANEFGSNYEKELEALQGNKLYIEIERMPEQMDYDVMEAFTQSIEDQLIKSKLQTALNRKKPFHNFKNALYYSGDYRKKWSNFLRERYIEWIRKQVID